MRDVKDEKIAELEAIIDNQTADFTKLDAELARRINAYCELAKKNDELKACIEAQAKEFIIQHDQLFREQQGTKALVARVKELEAQVAELEEELMSEETECESLEVENANLQAAIEQLEADLRVSHALSGDRSQEAGDRSQEAGVRSQEAGDRVAGVWDPPVVNCEVQHV